MSQTETSLATKDDILATRNDIANLKKEIIKWMFFFWVATIALGGLLKAICVI
jgi:phosphate/sulfate permease